MHDSDGTYSPVKVFANIFIAFVGAGVLGLPYAFKEAGVIEGTLLMITTAIICVRAMLMIIECKNRLLQKGKPLLHADDSEPPGPDDIEYGDVAAEVFGMKGWWTVQISIVLSQIGFCVAYLIFITKNMHRMFPHISANSFLMFGLIPLALLSNIRDLKELGLFSLFADFANVFAYCIVFWFDYAHIYHVGTTWDSIEIDNFPFFFGVAVYCYEGAAMILALEYTVPVEHRAKFPKLFVIAISAITTLYIVFGVSGFISFGEETNKIITLNLPKGIFPLLVKAFLCLSLFFTFPVMMFPVSRILDKALAGKATGLSMAQGTALRCFLVALTAFIMVLIPDFSVIMGLIGSSCCMILALILPGLMYAHFFKSEMTKPQLYGTYSMVVIGALGAVAGTLDALARIQSGGGGGHGADGG